MRVVSLVVDRSHRNKGIGKRLLQAAEEWARQQGCWVIEVTSGSHRRKEGTHDFYMSQGYLKNGSQAYFRKVLEGSSACHNRRFVGAFAPAETRVFQPEGVYNF